MSAEGDRPRLTVSETAPRRLTSRRSHQVDFDIVNLTGFLAEDADDAKAPCVCSLLSSDRQAGREGLEVDAFAYRRPGVAA
jgi:hypothetical protein